MNHRLLPLLTTALAPLIWGTTYLVTTEYLPPARPLTAAVLRALPAGLLLLLWTREKPCRDEITRLMTLSVLNIALFQAMLFISAYRLPGGLAAILNSTQTLWVLAFMALAGSRPPRLAWLAAALGILGIMLLVASPQTRFDPLGIAAALTAALTMAAGVFLTKHWHLQLSVLALTGWQLCMAACACYRSPSGTKRRPPCLPRATSAATCTSACAAHCSPTSSFSVASASLPRRPFPRWGCSARSAPSCWAGSFLTSISAGARSAVLRWYWHPFTVCSGR